MNYLTNFISTVACLGHSPLVLKVARSSNHGGLWHYLIYSRLSTGSLFCLMDATIVVRRRLADPSPIRGSLGIERRACGGRTYNMRKPTTYLGWTQPCATLLFVAVMITSPPGSMSIFVNGRLKPGVYKVQNLASQTYIEILEPSRELCCRPAAVLSPKDASVGLILR